MRRTWERKNLAIRTVQLDDLFVDKPRFAVQPVHILCNETDKLTLLVERLDKIVADIWLGVFVGFVGF